MIWWRLAAANFSVMALSRLDFYTFLSGKCVRMFFFFFLIISLFSYTPTIGGYRREEVLLFFALMNAFDVLAQLVWFRGLTEVQRWVQKGEFDFILSKPVSPLFFSSFRIFDFFDLSTAPAMIFFLVYAFQALGPLPLEQIISGTYLCGIGFVLAYSIVLALSSLNFWTTEIHNAFWLYREAFYMAQYPPEMFPKGIQYTFIYAIPLFVIVSFPAKAFLGYSTFGDIILATVLASIFLCGSLALWRSGLRHYTSASS
ncbi:MAG: ABC-2 family transporter protein [Patescibacteria group bacterium]